MAVTGQIAREAGALARTWFDGRDRLQIETKGPQDLVGETDRAVEVLIRERLVEGAGGWCSDILAGDRLTRGARVIASGRTLAPAMRALAEGLPEGPTEERAAP